MYILIHPIGALAILYYHKCADNVKLVKVTACTIAGEGPPSIMTVKTSPGTPAPETTYLR